MNQHNKKTVKMTIDPKSLHLDMVLSLLCNVFRCAHLRFPHTTCSKVSSREWSHWGSTALGLTGHICCRSHGYQYILKAHIRCEIVEMNQNDTEIVKTTIVSNLSGQYSTRSTWVYLQQISCSGYQSILKK